MSNKRDDRTMRIFPFKPPRTLKDDFDEVKNVVGLLSTEIKALRCEISELKQILISNS